jgi:hypothetical protein
MAEEYIFCYGIPMLALFLWLFAAGAIPPTAKQIDGHNFALVGQGTNEEAGYQLTLYVDEQDARRAFPALVSRAGGRTRARLVAGDHAPTFLLWGHFGKLAVMKFSKAFDGAALRALLAEPLEAELQNPTPVVKEASDNFLALFEPGVKEGDEVTLRTWDDGRIEVSIAGAKHVAPQNPKLARALWSIWLGPKPISKELQRALVDHIDVLGR